MTWISIVICTAELIFPGSLAMSDASSAGNNRRDSEEFARSAFPLPDQPTFEAELTALEDVIAAKVAHPAPESRFRDRLPGHELRNVLELVQKWPAATFRESLVRLLNSKGDFQLEAGSALLAYGDAELAKQVDNLPGMRDAIEELQSFRDHEPPLIVHTRKLWWDKRPLNRPAAGFSPVESLLPDWKDEIFRKLKWPGGMTVAGAAAQLNATENSVRLQSWLWLAQQGIIAPTEAVLESWPRLADDQKRLVTEVRPKFTGRRRLLMLFEQLLFLELAAGSSRDVQRELRLAQVRIGSALPTAEARRVLHLGKQRPDFFEAMTSEERDALDIICEAPDRSDMALLLQLRKRSREWIAFTALEGLCRIDHADAIHEVGEFLITPSDDYRYSSVVGLIQQQSVLELQNRDQYLAALVPALRACLKPNFGRDVGERLVRESLVDAFECMSGQDFKMAARAEQKKMVRGVSVGVGWNSRRGGSTYFHRIYADLPTAVGTVGLRWYDGTINAQVKP